MSTGQQHYTGTEGREYHGQKRAIPPEAFEWVARLRAERLQQDVSPNDTVFEYGVGSGWNLAALNCGEKVGYDVSSFLAPELTTRGIRFVANPSELPDHFADTILCYHTLEHVITPPDVLQELKRCLKPGGKLLVFVPYEKERWYRRYNPAEPNHHLYSWNVQTLGNLLTDCGWRVEQAGVQRYGFERIAAKYAVRFRLGEPGFRALRALVWMIRPILEVRIIAR
jgi:SAM-dependent methyltransferase